MAETSSHPLASLAPRALPVFASGPATGSTLAFLQLFLGPADAAFSGAFLLGVLNPTDELISGKGRDVLPRVECHVVGDQGLAKVTGKLVYDPTGYAQTAHGGHGND